MSNFSDRPTVGVEVSLAHTTSNVRGPYVSLRVRETHGRTRLVEIELDADQFMQLMAGRLVEAEARVPAAVVS